MSNLPVDIAQQALDAAGVDYLLGDLEDGSRHAQVLLRAYGQCLQQLLRAANWDFARKTAQMAILADATGNTPNVGTTVPVPWCYEYEYPQDCAKVRFIPWNYQINPGIPPGNIQTGFTVQAGQPQPGLGTPPVTGLGNPCLTGNRIIPARFVIATDSNYPPFSNPGVETLGVSPQTRTVILTNVAPPAMVIYTQIMLYPSNWDSLFRAALVAYLASEIALPLAADKKLGMVMRDDQIKIAKSKVELARIRDGNEGFSSSNLRVDWMAARRTGGYGGWGYGGWGDGCGGGPWGGWGGWGGWDSCGFSDGTAY